MHNQLIHQGHHGAVQIHGAAFTETEKAAVLRYHASNKSANTKRAYENAWAAFTRWCDARPGGSVSSLPAAPATVAVYLSHLADEKSAAVSTIVQHSAAIGHAHRDAGLDSPTADKDVRRVLDGVRRSLRGKPKAAKTAATGDLLNAMLANVPTHTLTGLRDRALLLLGFYGAFRRSELVAITVADLEAVPEGLRVWLRHSKTDQYGAGRAVPVPFTHTHCPVAAVRAWLDAAGITGGAVLRSVGRRGLIGSGGMSTEAVAQIIKRYATAAGLDAAEFAGHSLRSGFLTSAAERGADLAALQRVSGHKTVEILLNTYIKPANLFANHAAGKGLL